MAETDNKGEKMVSIPASEWAEVKRILGQLDGAKGPKRKTKEVKERVVRLALVDGKPVVGFRNLGDSESPEFVYEAPNPKKPNESILFIDIKLHGEEGYLKVKYNQFMRETRMLPVKVLEIKEEPWLIEQGETERTKVDYENYRSEKTGDLVPLEVEGVRRRYVVDFKGEKLEVGEEYVNIK